jgi:MinD-like ATPase involved in chromosome partitioning or flagellar assembly
MGKQSSVVGNAKDIHIVLGAKGGIGKTYVASLLAQYATRSNAPMKVLDLDQSNSMLARIPSLNARAVDLLTDAKFDSQKMDALLETMMKDDGPFLIDVGASTFVEVWRYLTKYGILSGIEAEGFRLVIHTVIVGGPEMADVLAGLKEIISKIEGRQVVVWLNPIRGKIERNGKTFQESEVYKLAKDKILALVPMSDADEATLNDLHRMAQDKHTLLTVDSVEQYQFFTKRRLKTYRDELFIQLDGVWSAINGAERAARATA